MANLYKVGKFTIDKDKRLGQGNYGTVYLGTDEKGRSVAGKEIFLGDDDPQYHDPDYIARVKAEVYAHRWIPEHVNLVKYVDTVTKGNNVWVFTDPCKIGDFHKYMKNNDVSERQKFLIMKELAQALHHLHSLDPPVSHRDVKCENILMGDDGHIKLCDLGLAKFMEVTGNRAKTLKTNCGTHEYKAPELFILDKDGRPSYTIKVDVFSAGIFFISLINASSRMPLEPFILKGESVGRQMYDNHRYAGWSAPPIKFRLQDSPHVKQLKVLINTMIQFDPDDRPTMGEVLDELNNILASMPANQPGTSAATSGEAHELTTAMSRLSTADVKPKDVGGKAASKDGKGEKSNHEPTDGKSLDDYRCTVQDFCRVKKEHIVNYFLECVTSDDDYDSDSYEFAIASEYQLDLYNFLKYIIGVEAASKFPKNLVDIEGNTIPVPVDPGRTYYSGTVKYTFTPTSYINVTLEDVSLCHTAQQFIDNIEQATGENTASLALEFVQTFNSHFVVGESYVGSLVEWVVQHAATVDKMIAKQLTKKLLCAIENLDEVEEGRWYKGTDLIKKCNLKDKLANGLDTFRLRVTKHGNMATSQRSSGPSTSFMSGCQIPLSLGDSPKIYPVWKLLADDKKTTFLLKEVYQEQQRILKKAKNKEKEQMFSTWKQHTVGCMPIYQLPCIKLSTEFSQQNIQKYEIGLQNLKSPVPEKVIMIVGATGSGKTTLVNSFVNYIYGVEFDDDFRLQLVMEGEDGINNDQASSQTTYVTSYTMHHQANFKVPYTLTLIDTPGFGDTGGYERDKKITGQIKEFFTSKHGIDHIDVIGFVAQSSLTRLTKKQQYIFDSILSLFGKDIDKNIVMLLTFADGQDPLILDGLKKAHLPYDSFFKFNNSAIFATNTSTNNPRSEMDALFWNLGMDSFRLFMEKIGEIPPNSLKLTKDVLDERTRVKTLQEDIGQGLCYLEQLTTEVQVLKKHEHAIEQNKDFTYDVTRQTYEKVNSLPGISSTNCSLCNRTCHEGCAVRLDSFKRLCCAMDWSGNCTICPQRCSWKNHKNDPFTYKTTTFKETMTFEDLKQRYQDANGRTLTVQQLVNNIIDDFEDVRDKVACYTNEVRQSLRRLRKIELKPNPLSTPDYIDILIESEKSQAFPGWIYRVKYLQEIKKRAEYLISIASEEFDPFKECKKAMEAAKNNKTNITITFFHGLVDPAPEYCK